MAKQRLRVQLVYVYIYILPFSLPARRKHTQHSRSYRWRQRPLVPGQTVREGSRQLYRPAADPWPQGLDILDEEGYSDCEGCQGAAGEVEGA